MRALPRRTAAFAVMASLLGAACTTPPESPDFPVPRYTEQPPIKLDVADIRVQQSYEPPLKAPNVEHLVPLRPADAARQWAQDRLQAVGETGTATLDIVDAAVTQTGVETQGGIGGWLTTEPEARYTASMELAMRIERPSDSGSARVRGVRGTGVLEGSSIHEREKVVYRLVKNLMDDLDGQMQSTLSESLAKYVAE
jgi:hypothetical protein